MKRIIFLTIFFIYASLLSAQNIVIDNGLMPNEPSIAINFVKPSEIVAASNINNCYYSSDGGKTWIRTKLTSTYGVWGDPCIINDKFGNFYFFHLSNPDEGNWVDRIVCQKSSDGGKTWNNGSYTGLNGEKVQDKHWVSVDKKNNNIYVTWTQFDSYESTEPGDSSRIMFSVSADGGNSWSEAKRINKTSGDCLDNDFTVEGAVPTVGPESQVYVAWAGRRADGTTAVIFDKSVDFGKTWLEKDIEVCDIHGGWAYDIPGIYRANGMPVTVCDTSGGKFHGNIYINWSDQKFGNTDTDIWFTKSQDEGNTWSEPKRVNDDPAGKQQFFTWMTLDPVTGYIYIVFYDRRNYSDNNTDVFLAYSIDGGNTFINKKISDTPFSPNKLIFFGDYTNITAFDGIILPIWARADNFKLSVLTNIINTKEILPLEPEFYEMKSKIEGNYLTLDFTLRKTEKISLNITDKFGKIYKTAINEKVYLKGNYSETIEFIDFDEIKTDCFWEISSGNRKVKIKINRQT